MYFNSRHLTALSDSQIMAKAPAPEAQKYFEWTYL